MFRRVLSLILSLCVLMTSSMPTFTIALAEEEIVIEAIAAEEPVIVEEPVVEEPVVEEPVAEEPVVVEEPVDVEEPVIVEESAVEEPAEEKTEGLEEELLPEIVYDEPAVEEEEEILTGEVEADEPVLSDTCAHSNTDSYTWNEVISRPVDAGDGTHTGVYDVHLSTYCTECGTGISDEVIEKNVSKSEPHNFSSDSDTCYDCGAVNTCTHAGKTQDTWYTQVTEAVDNGNGTHSATYNLVGENYCSDCGVWFNDQTVIEANVVRTSQHYFYEGSCSECGAKNTCEHENTDTYDNWALLGHATDNGDGTHTGIYIHEQYTRCEDCNERLDYQELESNVKLTEEHRYTDSGECYACGADNPCEHANVEIYEPHNRATGTVTDNGDGTHTGVYDVVQSRECLDCGQWLSDIVVSSGVTMTLAHEYYSGVCDDCGAINSCAHENIKTYEPHNRPEGTVTDNGDGTHTGVFDVVQSRKCLDCGEWLNVLIVSSNVTLTEEHDYYEGVCEACGAANPCEHKNTETFEGYSTKGVVTPVDAKTHKGIYDILEIVECRDCGEVVSRTVVESNVEQTREHNYEDGVCWQCGYENTCKHPSGSRDTYTFIENWYFSKITADTHTLVADFYDCVECTECGETISEKLVSTQEARVEEHYFEEDGACWCGYTTDVDPNAWKAAPTVKATADGSSVTLTWTTNAPVKSFRIFEYVNGASSWRATTSDMSYTLTGVADGEHTYVVTPYDPVAQVYGTASARVTVQVGEPVDPDAWKVSPMLAEPVVDGSSVTLNWTTDAPMKSFRVYEYVNGSPSWRATTTGTSYTLTGVADGEHIYSVTPYDPNAKTYGTTSNKVTAQVGEAVDPNAWKASPMLAEPVVDGSSVTLNWTTDAPMKSFRVYEYVNGSPSWRATTTGTSYTLTGVADGEHIYSVTPYDPNAKTYGTTSNKVTAQVGEAVDPDAWKASPVLAEPVVDGDSVTLNWTTDAPMKSFRVYEYVNGSPSWRATLTGTSYTLTGVADGEHIYSVTPYDPSAKTYGTTSNKVTAQVGEAAPVKDWKTPAVLAEPAVDGASVTLSWTTEASEVKSFRVFEYVNGSPSWRATTTDMTYTLEEVGEGDHIYSVTPYDPSTKTYGETSNTVTATVGAVVKDWTVAPVLAEPVVDGASVTLTWTTEAAEPKSFRVFEFVNGVSSWRATTTGTSYTLEEVEAGEHTYVVTPYDPTGKTYGQMSNKVTVTVEETEIVKDWTTAAVLAQPVVDGSSVTLSWTTEANEIKSFRVFEYVNNVSSWRATATGTTHTLNDVANGEHTYVVTPYDPVTKTYGKVSNRVTVTVNAVKDWKTAAVLAEPVVDGANVTLTWTTEANEIKSFRIFEYVNGVSSWRATTTGTSYTLEGVEAGDHIYVVTPYDPTGKTYGKASNKVTATVEETEIVKSWKTPVTFESVTADGSSVTLTWSTEAGEVKAFRVFEYVNGVSSWRATTSDMSYTLTNVAAGEHIYVVTPYDRDNNTYGTASEKVYAYVIDPAYWDEAPVMQEPAQPELGKVELSWTHSVDCTYTVYEIVDGVDTVIAQNVAAKSYSLEGVAVGEHVYYVKPVITSESGRVYEGVASAPVTVQVASVLDGEVADLALSYIGSEAKLSWSAAPHAVGYNVYVYSYETEAKSLLGTSAANIYAFDLDLIGKYDFTVVPVFTVDGENVEGKESAPVTNEFIGAVKLEAEFSFDTGVILTWDKTAVEDFVRYEIHLNGDRVVYTGDPMYIHKDVELGESYYFEVYVTREVAADGEVKRSDGPASVEITVDELGKVEGASVVVLSDNEAKLTWNAVEHADSYAIYRAAVGGEFELIDTVSAVEYTDKQLTAGTEYDYYIVAAVNYNGKVFYGEASETVRALRGTPAKFTKAEFRFENGVNLEWEAMEDAKSYILLRDGVELGTFASDVTSYVDGNVELGKTYVYGLKTVYEASTDGPATATVEALMPDKVETIDAWHFNQYTDIDFSPIDYAYIYKLYRAKDGGEFECVQTLKTIDLMPETPSADMLFNAKDDVPAIEATYTYKISGVVNFNGVDYEGPCSDEVTVVFGKKPVMLPAQYDLKNQTVTLTWEPSEMDDVRGYNIFRRESSDGSFWSIATPEAGVTSYVDTDIEPGKTYQYTVSVLRSDGEDGPSDEIEIATSNIALTAPDVTYIWHIDGKAQFGFFPGAIDAVNVYRAVSGGEYELVQTIAYADIKLDEGFAIISDAVPALETTYTYKLSTVVNFNGTAYESDLTDEMTIHFGNVPEITSAEYVLSEGAIHLTWEPSERDDVDHYTIYWTLNGETYSFEVEPTATSYVHQNLGSSYKVFTYEITAVCADGVDGPGEPVDVTVQGLTEVPVVTLSYTDNVTHIAWTQVADADYYEIWRSVEMGEYEQIMTTELLTGTTYDETVTDLTAACAYKVRAVVDQNGTPVYGEFGDAVAISRGAAVADFAAAYDEAKHAVVLTWTEPENATGYVLNLNGTELEQPVGATFHEDYAINYEETRVYTITAIYENGTMTSEEITVTIPANPWTYEVENGEAKVTGYTGTLTENFTIPAEIDGYTVTTIGEYAFADRTDLTGTLTLPETLTDIRASAFKGCTGLTGELVIPDSVEDIGASAFEGCTGLTSVKLSANIDWIRMDTFSGCTGLDGEVIIPEGVYEIAGRAFANCSALDRVVIPSTVTFVEASAFSGVTLTEIEIHANLSEGELDNLSIAEGCTIYGYAGTTVEAYANENGYTFVALAGEAPALPETGSGFEYWVTSEEAKTAALTRYIGAANEGIVIPSEIDGYTVTALHEGLFYQRNDLSGDIVIPNTVAEIYGYAFYGCTGLNGSLTIPSSVTSIYENAFTGAAFTEMTVLGSKYPDLDELESLQTVYTPVLNETLKAACEERGIVYIVSSEADGITYTVDGDDVIVTGMANATGDIVIPAEVGGLAVTKIGEGAFAGNTAITSVTVEGDVTEICANAFNGCTALTTVTLPNTVEVIGARAFYGCTSLSTMNTL